MLRRSSTLLAATSAAAVLALTGCGSGSGQSTPKDPKGELTASVSNLGQSDSLTTTVKLEIDPADLQALAKSDGDNLTAADAEAIASAQLVVQAHTTNGKDLAELKPGDTNATAIAVRGVSKGHTYLELRVISGDLYIQGDVKGILDLAHKSKTYAEVRARAASLPMSVKALVNRHWVSLSGTAAQGVAG